MLCGLQPIIVRAAAGILSHYAPERPRPHMRHRRHYSKHVLTSAVRRGGSGRPRGGIADGTKRLWLSGLLYTVRIAKNRCSPTGQCARWGNATQAARSAARLPQRPVATPRRHEL